jgi:hypothetical protein
VRKASLTVAACATLLWAGSALATETAQEKCDSGRITAWKTYQSCVDTVVAKEAGCEPNGSCPASFDKFAAFAKCRHTYFNTWAAFQLRSTLSPSTCFGGRFVDNGDGTATDILTGLVWEKKTGTVGGASDYSNPENVNNLYQWSTGDNKEDGNAFTAFLTAGLNTPGFAGANGWRLPTLAELQTLLSDFPCTRTSCSCGVTPCFGDTGPFGPTQSLSYWSATSYVPTPGEAWSVDFGDGSVNISFESGEFGRGYFSVRAVRGGL